MKEKENGLPIELHTIELSKFIPLFRGDLEEDIGSLLRKIRPENSLDIWAAFLTRAFLLDKDRLPELLQSEGLKKALDVLYMLIFTFDERDQYELCLDYPRDRISHIESMELARNEARRKGKRKALLEIAERLMNSRFPIDKIMLFTGLSRSDIEGLSNKENGSPM